MSLNGPTLTLTRSALARLSEAQGPQAAPVYEPTPSPISYRLTASTIAPAAISAIPVQPEADGRSQAVSFACLPAHQGVGDTRSQNSSKSLLSKNAMALTTFAPRI